MFVRTIADFCTPFSFAKVMLVMTDGNNNAGLYEPLEGANIARAYGMDVYAIGIGEMISDDQQEVGVISTLNALLQAPRGPQ